MSRAEQTWQASMGWLRYAADLIYRGSDLLADRIITGLLDWVSEGEDRQDTALRALTIAVCVLVPTGLLVWPQTWTELLVVLALCGVITAVARWRPILAILTVVVLIATTKEQVLLVVAPLWSWRAYRAGQADDLPHQLHQVMAGAPAMTLDAAADAVNGLLGRRPWTAGKLGAVLTGLGCPPRERTITRETPPGKRRRKSKTATIREVHAVDLTPLLSNLPTAPEDEPDTGLDQAGEHSTDPAATDPLEDLAANPLLELCVALSHGASGTHLAGLVEHLKRTPNGANITTAQVRDRLAELGVRVRGSVRGWKKGLKSNGITVLEGVHRDDLQAILGPLPQGEPPTSYSGVATGPDLRKQPPVATPPTPVATPVATAAPAPAPAGRDHFDNGLIITSRSGD